MAKRCLITIVYILLLVLSHIYRFQTHKNPNGRNVSSHQYDSP